MKGPRGVQVDDIYSDDLKPEERPAVVAVVDVSGSEEFVEIARSGTKDSALSS